MALSDAFHYVLPGLSRRTSLFIWSIVIASVVFYFATFYIRKRREYEVCMSTKSDVTCLTLIFRQTMLSAPSMVVYRWKLYYLINGPSPWTY